MPASLPPLVPAALKFVKARVLRNLKAWHKYYIFKTKNIFITVNDTSRNTIYAICGKINCKSI